MQNDLLPTINWLVHSLAENVGNVTWPVDGEKTPDGHIMPVKHPIPPGKDIVLENKRIECDSVETRELLIALAKRFVEIETDRSRLLGEKRYDQWIPANQVPDGPHSSHHRRRVLVTSPALQYVVQNGVCEGFEDNGWFVVLIGKEIRHAVTHWRHLPPAPQRAPFYDEVKEQAEALRELSKGI